MNKIQKALRETEITYLQHEDKNGKNREKRLISAIVAVLFRYGNPVQEQQPSNENEMEWKKKLCENEKKKQHIRSVIENINVYNGRNTKLLWCNRITGVYALYPELITTRKKFVSDVVEELEQHAKGGDMSTFIVDDLFGIYEKNIEYESEEDEDESEEDEDESEEDESEEDESESESEYEMEEDKESEFKVVYSSLTPVGGWG